MGLLEKMVAPVQSLFASPTEKQVSSYRTLTEYAPAFSAWDSRLYEQMQIRSIVECISTWCSKLKPEFVTPDESNGALPRMQRLVKAWPNDMQSWPDFIRLVIGRLLVYTTTYIVPGYDENRNVVALYSLNPSYAEVVEYQGEPWMRFTLKTGERQAFPFYDVGILTRFQLDSDIFGGGNTPLTPTLRLMDAQRQAEEIALKTGADIRFIGKLSGMVHEKDMNAKRDRFAKQNLSPSGNPTGLMVYDQTFEDITQIKDPNRYTISTDEMARIDKALFEYFTINEKILNGSYNDQEGSAFYESCIEPKGIQLGNVITRMCLTPTQVRKGNYIMFSASYLEYASPDSKLKVSKELGGAGMISVNDVRDIFQMPHIPGGNVRMIRGEYYMVDDNNEVIAESGGRANGTTDHASVTYQDTDDLDDLDEPEEE
ncbi:MAG: phage portal protein [Atopobiaceae bacterium]|nr:phage portal protein [Atopobiaceae bacterium]MBR3161040.1 phage portal protein [Atopobiaceae bacterium]